MKPFNKKSRPNYFQQNISQNGVNFLQNKNAQQLKNDMIRVFRDLSKRNIDVEKDGEFFLDIGFISIAIDTAFDNYNIYYANYQGNLHLKQLGVYRSNEAFIDSLMASNQRKYEAFNLIYNYLFQLRESKDVRILNTLMSALDSYRNVI